MVTRGTEELVEGGEVNEEPQPDIMCSGTPNLETHAERKAAVQEEDVASTMETASGQRIERLTEVEAR